MIFQEKEIKLKNGAAAVLRSPGADDAEQVLSCFLQTLRETPYLLTAPEECTMTVSGEADFLEELRDSENSLMIVCVLDGQIVGNCQLRGNTKRKTRHRGGIGIAVQEKYWGLGIGTAMLQELISVAKDWGLQQLELEVIKGNQRAMGLYKKMGFETVAATPNAIRLEDGTLLKEFLMVRPL